MLQQGKSQRHPSHFCLGGNIFCLLHIPHILLHRPVTPTMCAKLTSPGKYLSSVLYLVLITLSSISKYLTLTCYTTVVNYRHKLTFLKIICYPILIYFLLYWMTKSLKTNPWNLIPCKERICFMLWSVSQCLQTPMFFSGMMWILASDIACFLNSGLETIPGRAPILGGRWHLLKWPLAATAEPFLSSTLSFLPVLVFIQDFWLLPSGSCSLSPPPEK